MLNSNSVIISRLRRARSTRRLLTVFSNNETPKECALKRRQEIIRKKVISKDSL